MTGDDGTGRAAGRRAPVGVGNGATGGAKGGPPGSVDEVLALVRARGGRATASRRVLLEVLFERDVHEHRSVEDLASDVQARVPDVHISTIYRNLEELERLGVIVHSHLGHGAATYQLATGAHAHLVCERCGRRIEAPDDLFAGLSAEASARYGFTVDPRHFAILGRCADCAGDPAVGHADAPRGHPRPPPGREVH